MKAVKTIEERFWSKVDKTGDCWVWKGQIRSGNPYFSFNGRSKSARIIAAFGFTNRVLCSANLCGNDLCVNPKHTIVSSHHDVLSVVGNPWGSATVSYKRLRYTPDFIRAAGEERDLCFTCDRKLDGTTTHFGFSVRSPRYPGLCRYCANTLSGAIHSQDKRRRKITLNHMGETSI